MQVFSTFFKIVKRQIGSCALFFGIFIGLLTILSNMGGEQRHDYESYSCQLAIFDRDGTEASAMLVKYLEDRHSIVSVEDDDTMIQNDLYYEVLDYVLYIEDGYEKTGKLTNIKRPGSNTGMYVDNQIESYENSMQSLMASGYTLSEAYDITMRAMDDEGLVVLKGKNVSKKPGVYYFFLYLPYILMMMLFSGLGPVLVAFNRREVSDRVNLSATPVRVRNRQLVLGCVTFSAAIWILFIIFSFVLYGGKVLEDGWIYGILNALAYTAVAMSMVSIAGNFNLSQQNISMISNVVGLGFCFMGGVYVPMEIFGDGLLAISRFLPTYWYVRAHDGIMLGSQPAKIVQYIGIELLFAMVYLAVAMLISKQRKLARTS